MNEPKDNPPKAVDSADDATSAVPDELSILPIDNMVVYPFMIAPIIVSDEKSKRLIENTLRGERIIGIFTRRPEAKAEGDPGKFGEIYEVGTAAAILKMLRIPDGTMRLLLHGVRRIRIGERLSEDPWLRAKIEVLEDRIEAQKELDAMVSAILPLVQRTVQITSLPEDLAVAAMNLNDPGKLADLIASNLSIKVEEQQEILEIADVKPRLERVMGILNRELEMLELGQEIQTNVKVSIDKNQREYLLREQMKAIRQELGESDGGNVEVRELHERLEAADMPVYARDTAARELRRMEAMPTSSAEYTVSRTYLDWIFDLPWRKRSKGRIDIKRAQKILDQDHFGLEKVKERVIEHLAVIKLKRGIRGPILCFVGPPGVGKTSLGRSIARAMGRKFFRMALGGMRDEAEIRGHRRTYIGAMPGRILKGLKDCDANNPIVMLDEVDKIGADFRGDPASALLEVLDPEQNNTFTDNYLDMAFDLSNVMFVTTANVLDTIPAPLRDRMEILFLSGYTLREKIEIAKKYLVPRQIENAGLKTRSIKFEDAALETIVDGYTREAGLRNLEREIGSVCRKVARRYATGDKKAVTVTAENVPDFLGPVKFTAETFARESVPGVATGLAWTQHGGEILFIEVSASAGTSKLNLTGQLGDVMKESAQAAITYLKTLDLDRHAFQKFFNRHDLHVHIPAGAIPKDGPSAGISMCAAVASLAMNRPVRERLAMTGEITLKGHVLPVGGIKEKVLGAHRAGIRAIILPARNEKDLEDIPAEVRHDIEFHFVDRMSQVLELALDIKLDGAAKVKTRKSPPRPKAKPAAKKPAKKSRKKKSATTAKAAAKKTAKKRAKISDGKAAKK